MSDVPDTKNQRAACDALRCKPYSGTHAPDRACIEVAKVFDARDTAHEAEMAEVRAEVERLRGEVETLRKKSAVTEPVYCKHCPFSKHVHYEVGGKLVTPGCPGFEPEEIDQGKGH